MKKYLSIFLVFVLVSGFVYGLEIVAPKGPPSVPLIKLTEDNPNYKLSLYTDILTEVIPEFMKADEKIYVMPTNVMAKFYNKNVNLKILNVTSSGMLYILSNSNKIKTISDLKNDKIYVPAPGSSPDIVTRYYLKKKGINVDIKYSSSPEIAKLFIAGKIQNCVLPEPYASKAIFMNKKAKRILNFKEGWKNIAGTDQIPQVGLVAKVSYIEANKKEIDKFLMDYKKAVNWVNNNPKIAAKLASKKLGISEKIIELSIPKMNLISLQSKQAYKVLKNYFNILNEDNKKVIGGKIPDEKIIYK
ncbi:MAG: ABC transporter substrate-binding protein [Candidatus Mcinerneyibacterium aminivorans]|jgi:NitT/TauT family transport system substrate-binding protein|uniref:ABC transporter substrate-binding protein n=1 Tax=Candidatus Mcinerneyibacterium aminivorans TaxID=2703815 RepID=A0A5D0MFK2_9BACT|nr:MAG: ABC transporter substrate-binding protein [Candidatus Mcinerneyibacterium aminivorans]